MVVLPVPGSFRLCPALIRRGFGTLTQNTKNTATSDLAITSESSRLWMALECIAPVALLLLFFALKSYALNPAISDENIYFYDAWLMIDGHWPYRDFFFAHPPLHLIPGWLLLSVTDGFNLQVMKGLPLFAAAVTSVIVFFIARRAAGPMAAIAAMALFLLSHDVLRASSHWTGINWSLAWMTAGMLLALRGQPVASGVLLGLGICTGIYVAPAAAVLVIMLLIVRPRHGKLCFLALAFTTLVINGFFWFVGGEGFIDGVYRYHLLKPPGDGTDFSDQAVPLLFHNFFVLAGPVYLAPLTLSTILLRKDDNKLPGWRLFLDPEKSPGTAIALWCIALWLAYILFLSLLGRVFQFYFLLMFPAASVCGGIFVAICIRTLQRIPQGGKPAVLFAAMFSAVVAGFYAYPFFEHRLPYFDNNSGKTIRYSLPPSALPSTFQKIVEKTIWRDYRTIGNRYTGVQYYLWHESRFYDEARPIADFLGNNSQPNEALFGDSTSTPLLALMAGRRIVDNFVDTNAMRFRAGLPSAGQAISRLRSALLRDNYPLTWVLLRPGFGITRIGAISSFLEAHFRQVKEFRSRYHGTFILMRSNTGGESFNEITEP